MSFEKLTDTHAPTSTELFLDTSIHCSRHKGPDFRDRIATTLGLFKWKGTSTYAKTEYGNVVLSKAEYYIAKLRKLGSLERTIDFIGNVLREGTHDSHKLWSFNLLKRACADDDHEATERALLTLTRLMKVGVAFVEELCDKPITDGTNCYWAKRGVRKKSDGSLEWQTPVCKPSLKRCRIDEFFHDNRETFQRIKNAIDESIATGTTTVSAQLRGFSDVIGKALSDPTTLLDYRTGCKRLADAIIAVDSIGFRSMFSQNKAESDLLCNLLGQAFYYLPPNFEHGVLVQLPG